VRRDAALVVALAFARVALRDEDGELDACVFFLFAIEVIVEGTEKGSSVMPSTSSSITAAMRERVAFHVHVCRTHSTLSGCANTVLPSQQLPSLESEETYRWQDQRYRTGKSFANSL
jgi:hypothetical protein